MATVSGKEQSHSNLLFKQNPTNLRCLGFWRRILIGSKAKRPSWNAHCRPSQANAKKKLSKWEAWMSRIFKETSSKDLRRGWSFSGQMCSRHMVIIQAIFKLSSSSRNNNSSNRPTTDQQQPHFPTTATTATPTAHPASLTRPPTVNPAPSPSPPNPKASPTTANPPPLLPRTFSPCKHDTFRLRISSCSSRCQRKICWEISNRRSRNYRKTVNSWRETTKRQKKEIKKLSTLLRSHLQRRLMNSRLNLSKSRKGPSSLLTQSTRPSVVRLSPWLPHSFNPNAP